MQMEFESPEQHDTIVVACEQLGWWAGARSCTAARTPAEEDGPTALMQHRLARSTPLILRSMEMMLLASAQVQLQRVGTPLERVSSCENVWSLNLWHFDS